MTVRLAAASCYLNMSYAIEAAAALEAADFTAADFTVIVSDIVEIGSSTVYIEAYRDIAGDVAPRERELAMANEIKTIIKPFRGLFISVRQGPPHLHVPLPWYDGESV